MDSEEDIPLKNKISDAPPPRRKPKRIVIPRRKPSIVVPEPQPRFITADKTTCAKCDCFPKEDPYRKPKRLLECQKTPLTLYELAAKVVDKLKFPDAFNWSIEEVAEWLSDVVGLPEYRECILDNHIDGMRLLMLEDPSKLPMINIHDFKHIKMITAAIRREYSTEFVLFARSIGLPLRKPLTHCTWFKSRTGPNWGIRKNWSRSDILRWMKIIMPAPIYWNHWDLVWYQKPDFPKVMFARIPKVRSHQETPHYKKTKDVCWEYLAPRKFRLQEDVPEEYQVIWMEKRPEPNKPKKEKKVMKFIIKEESTLLPKKVCLDGKTGINLILARRLMPRKKFFTK